MMHTTRQRNRNSRKPHGKMNLVVILIIVAAVFAGIFMIGFLPRMANKKDLEKTHELTVGSVPIVQTVIAKRAPFKEQGNLHSKLKLRSVGAMRNHTSCEDWTRNRLS
jgi:uncharacterized membrane protein